MYWSGRGTAEECGEDGAVCFTRSKDLKSMSTKKIAANTIDCKSSELPEILSRWRRQPGGAHLTPNLIAIRTYDELNAPKHNV